MKFRPNISLVDVIKNVPLVEHILEIFSGVTGKFFKNSWKEFEELKNINGTYYSSDFHDVRLNYYDVELGTLLRFRESKGWINEKDPY